MIARTAKLNNKITQAEKQRFDLVQEIEKLRTIFGYGGEHAGTLAKFDRIWEYMSTRERIRFLHLIIEHIDYDGRTGEIEIFFHDTGIKALKVAETPDEQGQVA